MINTSDLLPAEYFVDITSYNLSVHNRSGFTLIPLNQKEPVSAVVNSLSKTNAPSQADITPWIMVNPFPDHHIGDVFEINGTTNLGTNYDLSFWISRQPIRTFIPSQNYEMRGNFSTIPFGYNESKWSFPINTSDLGVGYYDIIVYSENLTISDWQMFFLHESS